MVAGISSAQSVRCIRHENEQFCRTFVDIYHDSILIST